MGKSQYEVTPAAMRPAEERQICFYCRSPVGDRHNDDCVLIKKKVMVRMIVEYPIEVPAHWNSSDVESNRNMGMWCADNALDELKEISEADGCLCSYTKFEYVYDFSSPYLSE